MDFKLVENNSDELVVFFLGWGMDSNPMKNFVCDKNIVYFFDYSSLDFDFDFSNYKKYYLVAYSAGVYVAALLKDLLPKFDLKCAINGTLNLVDEEFGLPVDVIKGFENLNLENYMKFRREFLVKNDEELVLFNKNAPLRTFESCFEELNNLKKIYKKGVSFDYDKIFVSNQDKIIPTQNQLDFWKIQGKTANMVNGGHFPFFGLKSIEKIL